MVVAAKVSALILAGGHSRRMGTDKALLQWQGVPLLQQVYTVAEQCCSAVWVVTPWPKRYRSLLPDGVGWQLETSAGQGPLRGFAQGLEAVTSPWVLLLACDMPLLETGVIQRWIAQLPNSDPEAIAYVPYAQNRWEPLCGLYHKENSRASLKSFINAGGDAFQEWLATIAAVPLAVDVAIASMLWNCNSPEDLATLKNKFSDREKG